jgi:hypothetical protein
MPNLLRSDEIREPTPFNVVRYSSGIFINRIRSEIAKVVASSGCFLFLAGLSPILAGKTRLMLSH